MKLEKEQHPDELYVFIQVSKGSKNFYTFDKETETLIMTKTLNQPFPGNYGNIPETFHDDAQALDAIVLTEEPIEAGTFVKTKPIGVVRLMGKVNDDIVISVPIDKKINDISELSMKQLDKITEYFESFKNLKTQKVFDSKHARKIVEHAIKRHKEERR